MQARAASSPPLWNISDQRSNDLMSGFYRFLKSGLSKDEALRKAKMQFVDNSNQLAHPYFWAGFVPMGDMNSVEMAGPKKRNGLLLEYLGGLIVAIAFGVWFISRKKKTLEYKLKKKLTFSDY